MRATVAIGVTACLALLLGITVLSGSASPPADAATTCVTTGPIVGLSDQAATNARIVAAEAEKAGGTDAAVIAVMVGYTESGLRVLGNSTVNSAGMPTQGVGSNYDSLGIFQQRGSWGSVAQRLDPAVSTVLFMDALTSIDWSHEPPWVAAQDVQRSAFDGNPRAANNFTDVYGGNYRTNLGMAQAVVAQVDRDTKHLACGALPGGLDANPEPGSHGLPRDYVIPANANPSEAAVVSFAIAQLDKPYVFGAAGPMSFDCSGLTMAAWAQAGVGMPHSSELQAFVGSATTTASLAPGDLVLVPGDDGSLAAPGHVGLYIGDGLVLNAADEQDGIRVQTLSNFIVVGRGLAAARHVA